MWYMEVRANPRTPSKSATVAGAAVADRQCFARTDTFHYVPGDTSVVVLIVLRF